MGDYVDPTTGGGIPAFDHIVSVFMRKMTFEDPLPTAGSVTALVYGPANGGSLLRDSAGNCYDRLGSTYSPKEWGAKYVSSSMPPDDTVSLQNWLDAPQPHIAVPGYAAITAPLICNASTNTYVAGAGIIQGSPTQAVAEDASILPTFYIEGFNALYNGFSTPQAPPNVSAMLVMPLGSTCAIHGVGLIAEDATLAAPYDVIDALGKSDLIDGHSYLQGGYINLKSGAMGAGGANLEIYDSSFVNALTDNADIFSPNAKVVRNSFAGAGTAYTPATPVSGNNISFGNVDILIADNIIQQAAGWAIDVHGARSVRIGNNFLDNNGKMIPGTGGIRIGSSGHVTVCGNTMAESAAATEGATSTPYAAHVTFAGADDLISLCGNVYLPIHPSSNNGTMNSFGTAVMIHPDYDYEVDKTSSPVLTNISIADNPAPQNIGVLSPNAATYLPSSASNSVVNNYLTGLTMTYLSGSSVSIGGGAASDSTNTILINEPPGCIVNLSNSGAGGLDTGTVASRTTYYFFVISGPGGAAPSCMASLNPNPTFVNTTQPSYQIQTRALTSNMSTIVYDVGQPASTPVTGLNANALAGMMVGDIATSPATPISYFSPTAIFSLKSYNINAPSAVTSAGSSYVTGVPMTGIFPGMDVGGMYVPGGTIVTAVNPGTGCTIPCIQMSQLASGMSPNPASPLTFGGNYTITLAGTTGASGTTSLATPANVTVFAGRYRMIGALFTNAGGNLVPFKQDGDTFYLAPSIADIPGGAGTPCPGTIGTVTTACPLSVPCGRKATCTTGIQVEAFGRIVTGTAGRVFAWSPDQSEPGQSMFPGPPGYTTQDAAAGTAFPFRLYTDTGGNIDLQSSVTAGATVYEVTDGWVLHRAP